MYFYINNMNSIGIFLLEVSFIITVITTFTVCLLLFCEDGEKHFNSMKKEDDTSLSDKFFNRFYFSTFIISTNGYGDYSPKSRTCKLICILFIFIIIGGTISVVAKVRSD